MIDTIQKFKIETELDVVLAYRSAMQLSEMCGLKLPAQTKFSTAVSEICRNVIEHVGLGCIELSIDGEPGQFALQAYISDNGRGIPNYQELLSRPFPIASAKGNGIFNSRRLVDVFILESEVNAGTKVWLRKQLPANHPPISKSIVEGWAEKFARHEVISPYAELKKQNQQLLELLEQLRLRNLEAEHQLEVIQQLNQELEKAHTEVMTLLSEREESNRRLQQANSELDAFAYTVSHDLKAPLRNIEGLSAAIQDSLTQHDITDALECVELVVGQAQRMDQLIAGILDMARIGMSRLEKIEISLSPFIHSLTNHFTVPPGFLIKVQPGLPSIYTEELLLAQVLINLINNAIKHHDKNKGKISVTAQKIDGQVSFVIEDDGPGVANDQQALIFRPFAAAISSTTPDSTGLGLSIVKRIVEGKGGKIWIESEGRGSRFCFTWPATTMAEKNAPTVGLETDLLNTGV